MKSHFHKELLVKAILQYHGSYTAYDFRVSKPIKFPTPFQHLLAGELDSIVNTTSNLFNQPLIPKNCALFKLPAYDLFSAQNQPSAQLNTSLVFLVPEHVESFHLSNEHVNKSRLRPLPAGMK